MGVTYAKFQHSITNDSGAIARKPSGGKAPLDQRGLQGKYNKVLQVSRRWLNAFWSYSRKKGRDKFWSWVIISAILYEKSGEKEQVNHFVTTSSERRLTDLRKMFEDKLFPLKPAFTNARIKRYQFLRIWLGKWHANEEMSSSLC